MRGSFSEGGRRTRRRRVIVVVVILAAAGLVTGVLSWPRARSLLLRGGRNRTVAEVIAEIGPEMEHRWRQALAPSRIQWPPAGLRLLAIKDEKRLEVWAAHGNHWAHVRDYTILGASGGPGPKLREGDCQVPEGLYRIEGLNPNSSYHLSMKLDYPNAFDREQARLEGRTHLGGDIFIHGSDGSVGCLAMGDAAIEELFALVYAVGRRNVRVIIVPNDLRRGAAALAPEDAASWVDQLHADLRRQVESLAD